MTVAAHFVYAGKVGGAEHMLYNLLRGLWRRGVALEILCARSAHLAPEFVTECLAQPGVRIVEVGGPGPRFVAEQRACFDAGPADAVLFPNYFVPPVVPRRLGRVVGVLHDLQYRHFPMHFSGRKRAWLRVAHALAIRRADRLVVISEFVRQDALRLLGHQFADKVVVIPNPISWDRFGPPPETQPPSGPCILAVAAQYPHKNLEVLLRAFAVVVQRRPDTRLVLCGQDSASLRGIAGAQGSLSTLAATLGVASNVEITGYIDDTALGVHYRRATLFAFPSLFEGFGMPPVEALGFGLPTLTTRCTALPEVTLGLAHYVDDPASVGEWAERIGAMLDDPERYRPAPADVSRLRAAYAPDRVAALYLDAYRT